MIRVAKTFPSSYTQLQEMLETHGGPARLARWGLLFYGMRPLSWAANAKMRVQDSGSLVVTGTQGKTTALRAIRHLLGLPVDVWTEANPNVRGEVPWTVLRERGRHPLIPVELGEGVGTTVELARWLRIRMLVLLNVGSEHLSHVGTLTGAAEQLADVVDQMVAGGVVIANGDDPLLRDAAARRPDLSVCWFGWAPHCEVRIENAGRTDSGQLWVDLCVAGKRQRIHTKLVGLHYAPVVAACTLTALHCGVPMDEITRRWETLPNTPARLEPMRTTRGAVIISDDFKATPETLRAGLAEVATWPGQRKWAVLGDLTNLPDDDLDTHYQQAAQWAAQSVTRVVTSGPRWAERTAMWEALPVQAEHAETLAAATQIVAREHRGDDLIYVKGCEETRIRRVSLALSGYDVTCRKEVCKIARMICEDCAELSGPSGQVWLDIR